MDDSIRSRVARATVTVVNNEELGNDGRGFFVRGRYVLTAAHCIPWTSDGTMALQDSIPVTVIAADGRRLDGQVLAIEPISDIAVIGNLEADDAFEGDSLEIDSSEGLVLCDDRLTDEKFLVHVFTHQREWVSGQAACFDDIRAKLSVKTEPAVPPGSSGSAIINDRGEVVGVVSAGGELKCGTADKSNSASPDIVPRPSQCLPVWLWQAIKAAEEGDK